MFCPIKFVDPSAHANMQCDPQCAWRAAEIAKQTEEGLEVYYYCGLISNSTRVEMVNLDGPVNIPLNPPAPPVMEMPEMPEMSPTEVVEDNEE